MASDGDGKGDHEAVAAFGLSRQARAKALRGAGEAIRAALNRDDAPDRVVGVLSIVVRIGANRRPDVALRSCVVWGTDGLQMLAEVGRDTLKHVAETLGATVQRKQKGH